MELIMAKTKKTAKKTTKKKAAKRPTLKQPPLIDGVRHELLDAACENLGAIRDKINRLVEDEDSEKQAALDYMVRRNVTSYHHFGTELTVRRGSAKLSVRKHKEVSTDAGAAEGGASA